MAQTWRASTSPPCGPPTFERLQEVLADAKAAGRPYHIVHFDGHGVYEDLSKTALADWLQAINVLMLGGNKSGKYGYLLFEHPGKDKMRPVSRAKLGQLLHDSGVPVLVLNACQSAMHEAASKSVDGAQSQEAGTVHDKVRAVGSLAQEYTRIPFRFTAGADTDDGRLEITGRGEGAFYVGAVSLMPADNVQGMRADVIAPLKEIGFTVYRWPGGLFVNDYDWRQATGDRDKRPPRLNNAYWSEMVESNDFGLDEFMTLCRVVGAEPYVVVSSSGENDDRMAAAEMEYLNGAADTPMGALRAAHGHPEPYNVKFWGVGNEMWDMPLKKYIERHNRIAEAMRAVDPTIKLIAVGGVGFDGLPEGGDWAQGMLTHCADHMDLISEHIYGGSNPDLAEHVRGIARGIRGAVEAHRDYREQLASLKGKDIRLALDEWNYSWEGRYEIYGEAGPRYYFRDALGVAEGLHEMFRNSDMIFMANTHPVNVHGQVKTTKTDAAMEATALVWELYRHHFGTLPLTVNGNVGSLDVAAAWSEDRQTLTLAVVNPTEYAHTLALTLQNAQLSGAAQLWIIANSDPTAYNEPGQPPRVTIEGKQLSGIANDLSVPPLSISLYELPASE